MDDRFNVASNAGLPGPVGQLYVRFEAAGYPDQWLPDDDGWMPTAPFSGQVVGRIAIRDRLSSLVASDNERNVPYTRAHQSNLMREGRVLERSAWPVQSIPAIYQSSLKAIARELSSMKRRRNRSPKIDCSSAQILHASFR